MSCQGKLAHVSKGDRGTRPGIYHRGDAACPGSIVVRLLPIAPTPVLAAPAAPVPGFFTSGQWR